MKYIIVYVMAKEEQTSIKRHNEYLKKEKSALFVI